MRIGPARGMRTSDVKQACIVDEHMQWPPAPGSCKGPHRLQAGQIQQLHLLAPPAVSSGQACGSGEECCISRHASSAWQCACWDSICLMLTHLWLRYGPASTLGFCHQSLAEQVATSFAATGQHHCSTGGSDAAPSEAPQPV